MIPSNYSSVPNPKFEAVSAKLEQHLEDRDLAGAVVLVAVKDEIVFFEAKGKADLGNDKPLSTDSIFRVHSMTKAITSVAALMLVERGQIELDALVSDYLPELRELKVHPDLGENIPGASMTVRHLMQHTAGFSYPLIGNGPVEKAYRECNVMDPSKDLAAMVEKLAELPVLFSPGSRWAYGLSTDVLGRVIEIASGSNLDEFFAKEILQPLGMMDTGFHVPSDQLPRLPACYTSNGRGRLIENDPGASGSKFAKQPSLLSGGGGLVSTASDYFRFLQMLLGKGQYGGTRLLSEESVKLMTTNQLPDEFPPIGFPGQPRAGFSFSLGLSVCKEPSSWDPAAKVGEYGWGGSASTHYWVSPKDEVTVILLQQTTPFSFLLELSLKPLIYSALDL